MLRTPIYSFIYSLLLQKPTLEGLLVIAQRPHPPSTGRNATSSYSLEVGSLECVLSEAGVPGLTSTYSGGWNDYSNYCSSIGLDRLPYLL